MSHDVDSSVSCNDNVVESLVNGRQLRLDQKKDPELASLIKDALPPSEIDKVSEGHYVENAIIMRKWRMMFMMFPLMLSGLCTTR